MAATVAQPFKGAVFDTSSYREDRTDSYLVSFTNGQLVSDEGLNFAVYEEQKAGNKAFKRKHIVAETEDMMYIGQNTGLFAPNHDYKYAVGIFDRKTQVCKLYSSECYILNPRLEGDDEKDGEEIEEVETSRQRIDALTSAFGGSKKKRTMEARHQNAISGDSLVGAMQTAATSSTTVNESVTPGKDSVDDIIPPYDLEAGTPAAAYPLDAIITDEMMNSLRSQSEEIGTKEKPVQSEFVASHLKRLPRDEDLKARRVAILYYLHHLIRLYRLTTRELRATKELLPNDMPAAVKRQIMQKFVLRVSNRPVIPTRQKDSILAYILVLALHLEAFKMEIQALSADCKISVQKTTNHLRVLGCANWTDKKEKKTMTELKMPLKLGEAIAKRTRKR